MAIHRDLPSLLRESLPQYIQAAKLLIETPARNSGGVLGYPAAVLLFSVIDAIGSFHRGDAGFRILVDKKERRIKTAKDHFLILNSHYFGQQYSRAFIDRIYDQARCVLTHNAAIARETVLLGAATTTSRPFWEEAGRLYVGLVDLLKICDEAVRTFLPRLDRVVPNSATAREIDLRSPRDRE